MRLAFMGSPDFAVPALLGLHRAGHEIAAVYCQPPKPAGRGYALRPCSGMSRDSRLTWSSEICYSWIRNLLYNRGCGQYPAVTLQRGEKAMASKTKITIGDLTGRVVPVEEGALVLLPVGGSNAKETRRTAQPTVITGDVVQKDRGIEFDYPKPSAQKTSKKTSKK